MTIVHLSPPTPNSRLRIPSLWPEHTQQQQRGIDSRRSAVSATLLILCAIIFSTLYYLRGGGLPTLTSLDSSVGASTSKASVNHGGRPFNETITKTTSHDHDANLFYTETWPPLQRQLCYNMWPNLDMVQTLFAIARYELLGEPLPSQNETTLQQDITPSKMIAKFFVGEFGGASVYMDEKNPKLTTTYPRIYKCGNNQVRSMEKIVWWNNDTKISNGTYFAEMPLRTAVNSLYDRNTSQYKRPGEVCIYTVVRDPISHFLSGYNEADFRVIRGVNLGTKNVTTFAPYFNVSYTKSNETRRQRFTQLVKDVVSEREELVQHYVYSHFFSMSRILPIMDHLNQSLSGYLPSVANLETEWPKFMTKTCPEMPPLDTFPPMKTMGQHRSSKDELGLYQAAKEVWNEQGLVARALCVIHAVDYACWQNLPNGIPPLCQKVFSSPVFLKAVLMNDVG